MATTIFDNYSATETVEVSIHALATLYASVARRGEIANELARLAKAEGDSSRDEYLAERDACFEARDEVGDLIESLGILLY